jgi:hypothetical protein
MAKLIQSVTVYVWPKDEETGEVSYSLYTDEEYNEECKDYGVDSLDGLQFESGGNIVDEIDASEDSYSAQGESLSVVNIPDEKYDEVKALLNLLHETENKVFVLFRDAKSKK